VWIKNILALHELSNKCVESIDENKKIKWKKNFITNFLREFEELEAFIRFLIHLAGGMPARGTELSTLLLKDCGTGRRSFFVDGNTCQLFIKTVYNKTQHSTGVKTIYRFFDEVSSQLILRQLLFFRPFIDPLSS
jgi:hypothetical protein